MADGGLAGRESMIMRTTKPILWNEAPGGEAFISLAPQKRTRSRMIHEEVGRLLGVAPALGGLLGAVRSSSETGGRGALTIPKVGGDVLRVSSAGGQPRNPTAIEARQGGKGSGPRRMHPEDIKAIGKELALAVRQMPRPRVDVDEFNRRLA